MQADAFDSEWQDEFEDWQAVRKRKQTSFARTRLRVIVLGPGEKSPGYDKRLKIREHLQQNPNNDVAFLEDLLAGEGTGNPNEIIRNQAYYVGEAQVVIALTVADEKVSGVLAELIAYRNMLPGFEDKSWILVPRAGGKDKGMVATKALIRKEVENFPDGHKLFYNYDEFRDCSKIRAYVEKQVEKTRATVFYDRVLARARRSF